MYITKRKIQVITLDLSPAYRSDPNARDVRLKIYFRPISKGPGRIDCH